jgi:hypothetical protein
MTNVTGASLLIKLSMVSLKVFHLHIELTLLISYLLNNQLLLILKQVLAGQYLHVQFGLLPSFILLLKGRLQKFRA